MKLQQTGLRGHAGHAENERCDTLAAAEAEKFFQ